MAQKQKDPEAKTEKKAAKLVKGYLPRDYRDHDGKVYGPGEVEVPGDSTIATFFTDPPKGE